MRAQVGWNGVEEPRGATSDCLRGNMAGHAEGLSRLRPRRLASLGSSTALRPLNHLRSAQNDFEEGAMIDRTYCGFAPAGAAPGADDAAGAEAAAAAVGAAALIG